MNVKVVWKENMHLTGTAASGHIVQMDSSVQGGGQNLGFRPMEMVAMGVAGCSSMDVISILRKLKVDFHAYEVEVEVTSASEYPKVFTDMHFTYRVSGHNIKREDVEKAVELSETKYCQGIAMMSRSAKISHTIEVIEDVGVPC
ncbi:MAG TPA: OsmC family protein [Anaerolineaceae bacterium]|nr:OsmC family protein [Anaerolineaceae bacterium]